MARSIRVLRGAWRFDGTLLKASRALYTSFELSLFFGISMSTCPLLGLLLFAEFLCSLYFLVFIFCFAALNKVCVSVSYQRDEMTVVGLNAYLFLLPLLAPRGLPSPASCRGWGVESVGLCRRGGMERGEK